MGFKKMKQIEEISGIIESMDDDSFCSFARELQYGLKWHAEAYQATQVSIYFNESPHFAGDIVKKNGKHKESVEKIKTSPLYDIIRRELARRTSDSVDNDWAGWIDFNNRFLKSREDVDTINSCISRIVKGVYPLQGVIRTEKENQSSKEAKERISEYGIKGFFIGDADLIDIFFHHYRQK